MHVVVTGAAGLLGSNTVAAIARHHPEARVTPVRRDDVDLLDNDAVRRFLAAASPDVVVHSAARVAGIKHKLERPLDFLMENLTIDSNVIGASIDAGVGDLVYISSAAVYPEHAAQPIGEPALLSGRLESANEGYGLAKIAGSKLCEYASAQYGVSYRAVVPSNLYGPGDNYTPGRAHLIASIIAKMHEAISSGRTEVEVWGDGTARREFTYAPDVADWIASRLRRLAEMPPLLNLGVGIDHSIREYYEICASVTGYTGSLTFDSSKASGASSRLLDSSRARELGWDPPTGITEGITRTNESFRIAYEGQA